MTYYDSNNSALKLIEFISSYIRKLIKGGIRKSGRYNDNINAGTI